MYRSESGARGRGRVTDRLYYPADRGRVRVRVRVRVGPSLARGGSPEQIDELALLELAALVGVVLVEDLIEPLLLLDVCLR